MKSLLSIRKLREYGWTEQSERNGEIKVFLANRRSGGIMVRAKGIVCGVELVTHRNGMATLWGCDETGRAVCIEERMMRIECL